MLKRKTRQQRVPEPERPLADYSDVELDNGIAAALLAAEPGAKAAWSAIKQAGSLLHERKRRTVEKG